MTTSRFSSNTEFYGYLGNLNLPSQPKSSPTPMFLCVQVASKSKCFSDGLIGLSVRPTGVGGRRFGRIGAASSVSKSNFSVEAKAGLTYKDAGVDIDAGTELVIRIAKMAPGLTTTSTNCSSVCGFYLIFLHAFTIAGAISGLALASAGTSRWFGVHMMFAVLTAIFQGSVAVLVFTRTGDFLGELRSYEREEDGSLILKLGGGLSALIFCPKWVVLVLAFWLKYYMYVEGNGEGRKRSGKVQQYEDLSWAARPFLAWNRTENSA